jgi:hypothetical protein
LVFPIVDILNGFSILYAFYCMEISELNRQKSQITPDAADFLNGVKASGPDDRKTYDTMNLNQILFKGEESFNRIKLLRPGKR